MRASLMSFQVIFLIALQAATMAVIWLLNPLTQAAADTSALYLSLDLLAFVLIAYFYRSKHETKEPNFAWLSVGYLALIVLLVSNAVVTA